MITLLGAGRVGKFIAQSLWDRVKSPIQIVDVTPPEGLPLEKVSLRLGDATDRDFLKEAVQPAQVVVNALPGRLGFQVLKDLIQMGKAIVDIAFMPEDPLELHQEAQETGAIALVDLGVAPGISHALTGWMEAHYSVEKALIYVGGLPFERTLPFEYKAPFSPVDVIEEYTRPARFRENGTIYEVPALSEIEHLPCPGIGTLEAFLTDGLRSLLKTSRIPTLREKTLRYPGHAKIITLLRDIGFFDTSPLPKSGIAPRKVTAELLTQHWQFFRGEKEFTFLRCDYTIQDQPRSFSLFDTTQGDGTLSMARMTGLPAVYGVLSLLEKKVTSPGVYPPESLAKDPQWMKGLIRWLDRAGIQLSPEVRQEFMEE